MAYLTKADDWLIDDMLAAVDVPKPVKFKRSNKSRGKQGQHQPATLTKAARDRRDEIAYTAMLMHSASPAIREAAEARHATLVGSWQVGA